MPPVPPLVSSLPRLGRGMQIRKAGEGAGNR